MYELVIHQQKKMSVCLKYIKMNRASIQFFDSRQQIFFMAQKLHMIYASIHFDLLNVSIFMVIVNIHYIYR